MHFLSYLWNLSGWIADNTKMRVVTSTGQSISEKQFSNVISVWKAFIVAGSNNVWFYNGTNISTHILI